MSQRFGSLALRLIQRHQLSLFQFLHCGEVQAVERTAISRLRMTMLPERRLENRCRQVAKLEWVKIARRGKLCLILPPLARTNLAAKGGGFQLYLGFEFRQ